MQVVKTTEQEMLVIQQEYEDRKWLITEVERLKAEVKRLRAILLWKRSASGDEQDLYQQGMEAAAVIAQEFTAECDNTFVGYEKSVRVTGFECDKHIDVAAAIRAAAKEQADG